MKKIYIFAAVIALLTLSLNAQMTAKKKVAQTQQATSTEKVKQPSIDLNFYKQKLTHTLSGPNNAPMRAGSYTLLNDDIDGSKYSTGVDIDNNLSAPWSATYLRNQSGYVLYIRGGGSMTFTVPSGYNNADFKFEFKTSTSYYNGYFTFTPSTGSAQQVTTSAASTVYECELTGLSAGNTVTITGKYGSSSYSPDFMYMYVYVAQSTPTITASPSSVNLTSAPNESATETVTVTGANLTSDITAAISGTDASLFSVSPASLGTSGGSLTVTYSPTAFGNHTATLTLSSTGAQDVTITLTGKCSNEQNLTVCDGQYVAQYFPYYGYYHDDSEHIQMIYPASILGSSMAGGSITSMTFYPTSGSVTWSNGTTESASGINFYNGSITFKVANLTNAGAFDTSNPSFVNATLTAVSTINMPGAADANATTWVITFDQPFEYTGGDLLIDVTNPTTGQWGLTFFAGDDTGDNAYSYITSGGPSGALAFLPKVTFTYEPPSGPRHDLAIALSAPATAGAGSTVNVTATVTNNGDFAENGYTVTVTDGTNIVTITATEELPVGQSAEFTVQFTTSSNDAGQTVNYTATVACTDDAVAANNTASASTSLINLPPPVNVAATPSGTSATVTWDAPTIAPVQQNLAWDFETQSQFNDWTLVSIDNDSYNWTYRTYDSSSSASVFEPHSGTGYIVSPSFVNNVGALNPDNWLISPEVTLGGTFTFWAKGTDATYYAENFGVFVYEGSYSSGVSGFEQVDVDKTATAGWVKYTFDLSQYSGQGRIAIRHYDCTDQYWLEVDDIEYQVTVPGEQPTSYNVYLDGTLVGSVNANNPLTYDFSNLTDGQHTAEISAVYTLGESALVPATFTISSTNPELAISPADQTIDDNAAGTLTVTGTDIDGNISVSAADNTNWSLNPTSLSSNGGSVNVTYTGRELSATTTVTASATGATDATATVNYVADLYIVGNFGTGWDFTNGTSMSYNNGTYTATLTVDAGNYILFARLLGNSNPWNTRDVFGPSSNGDWWMDADQKNGTIDLYDDDPIYFPNGGTYRITINANDGTFTIIKLNGEQTAPPVITSSSDGEYVTITATGDGTVTLNVPGCDPVSGEGEVSITVPCGYVSNTITVTATAQESGKDESDPTTAQITIPAGSGWVDMDGTYDDPNTLLSFLKDGEDIMMLDQFTESTLNNRHPDSYIYTLREDQPGGEPKKSTPVPIPVYKTSSTMQGFYTYNQIITDTDMHLKPQVINSKMTYDVKPDGNVLYYNLYRGNVGEDYPVIDDTHRVSKLQQFEEQVGDFSQFYLFESHTSGVIPRYDHVGSETVERLDTNYVQGVEGNEISYVPVIWTKGSMSARGDGKNNSYGSDIKRETLGAVEPYNIEIERSNGSAWGKWKVPGTNQEYCVYIPTITINGTVPAMTIANDKDKSTYVPFMYRAWCTYPAARAFSTDSETGSLIDLGPMPLPHLLGTEYSESTQAVITDKWDPGDGVLQCSFGGPADEYVNYDDVTFVVRLYYKKVVTEGDNTGSKLGDDPDDAEEYYIVQGEGSADDIETALREMFGAGAVPVSVTYVNAQGMQSSQPFDGLNIVITRYSDGSTTTSKIIR